jgi:hypothetical protein
MKIEIEKKKMVNIMCKYEEQVSRSPSPNKTFRHTGYDSNANTIQNDYERNDETCFESFYEAEGKEQYFYNPTEKNGRLVLNLLDDATPTNIQKSPTYRALKSQKSLGSMSNFDLDSLHPVIKVLFSK